jgi:hypothetical protein
MSTLWRCDLSIDIVDVIQLCKCLVVGHLLAAMQALSILGRMSAAMHAVSHWAPVLAGFVVVNKWAGIH